MDKLALSSPAAVLIVKEQSVIFGLSATDVSSF